MATSTQLAGSSDKGPPSRSFTELRGDLTIAVVATKGWIGNEVADH